MTEENMLSQNTSSDDIKAHGTDETADFSYDGYQVVRAEFFAHLFEPSVTLNKETVSVNAACLHKLKEKTRRQTLPRRHERLLQVVYG